ncbi:phasin family protein [Prosthecomicrobium sp. N25]|uniref:phasin family protein n=1 Tax=Prosthecomicrobium sp. N25 TaxID=3129254 RepID=UPI00307852B5
MADDPKKLEIPENLRDFTQKSVDQAKKAFDDYMSATQSALEKLDRSASGAQSGASDLNRKILELAEENVDSVFAHAQRLAKARDFQELVRLQTEFLKAQMANLGEQARVISDATAKTASSIVKSDG